MATSVGQINFGVSIDASGIAAELNRALTPALAQVQSKLDAKPLKVKIDIDTTKAIAEAQRALDRANLKIDVKVDVKFTASQRAAIQEIKDLSDKTITVRFNVNLTAEDIKKIRSAARAIRELDSKVVELRFSSNLTDDQLRNIRQAATAIRRLESKDVQVRFAINLTDDQLRNLRQAASAIRRLESKDIRIKIDIDADEARLRALAELLRNLRDRNLHVGVTADHSAVTRLSSALGSLTKYTAIGGAIGAGLSAIVGAAGAAAGAVGGLVGALAGLGPAVAAIGATAVVGFQGIKDAFSALSDSAASAASDASNQSDQIASAQDSLASAYDSAASAQQSLTDAQSNAADAAQAVADAYKTAQERLDGYTESLQAANLDEKEAALNLAEAQQKLAKGGFKDDLERQRAVLAVERAQLNLQKAQEANTKLQAEANDAQQKGIDQAPEVISAKKAQAQADEQVVAAQRGVAAANRQVEAAQRNLTKAQTETTGSADKFAQALAKLSPNAQAFVLAYKDISPALEESRKAVQDVLFQDLGKQLTDTATVAIPLLRDGMKGVAGELNGIAQGFFEFVRSADGIQLIQQSFAGAQNLLKGLREGTEGFGKALADVATAATPHLEGIGKAFGNIGTEINKAFSGAAGNGVLDQIFSGFEGTLKGVGDLLGTLTAKLLDIGSIVLPSLGPALTALAGLISDIAPGLADIGRTFLDSLTKIMPVLGPFIEALTRGLEPILPVLADLINALAAALTPLIQPLSQVIQILGKTLTDVVTALAPAIAPLAQAFVDLVTAVSPILPLVAEIVADFVEALAPALSTIFDALAPVIKQLADELKPVFDQLAPILAQVAGTIATALADAITQLAPLLPPLIQAWSDLILAIAPFIPQIVDLAVQFIPPLVDILQLLLPILTKIIEAFTWIVEHVMPYVIDGLTQMTDQWTSTFDTIKGVASWFTDTLPGAIGGAIDTVKRYFDEGITAIGTIWDGLKAKAATPVNFVIDTVLNNGLFKAWSGIDNLLGGVLPDAPTIPKISGFATGGGIKGPGTGTSDDILAWLSNGEHVVTAKEVLAAGGQNVLYAIRDMIARGIPFTWDNGKVITDLGRDNLNAYGAKVATAGIGNVPPEGLFDPLLKFATGGAIFPWMKQLQAGHEFAKAQNGKPYQWAGPRFVGDSFDCSGFMASIIAAIVGTNPWQRYWSTASFAGYPQTGAQGLVKGLTEGSGMAVGITNDPGGPGGGHTAGELRGIPELNIPAARVESGGSIGDVHYGRGTDPNSFASLYGLPIGANGFFQPTAGGDQNGPSVGEQTSFLTSTINKILDQATNPIRDLIKTTFHTPPQINGVPLAVLDGTQHYFAESAGKAVTGLGAALGGAWQKAKDLGGDLLGGAGRVLDSLNPFDTGGIANGTGILTKNTIEPERVLSPEQTKLFEALVEALTKIATTGLSAAGAAAQTVTVDLSKASVDALRLTTGVDQRKVDQTAIDTQFQEIVAQLNQGQSDLTELISSTAEESQRTASNSDIEAQARADEQTRQLLDIANRLSQDVLGPILSAAVGAGTDFLTDLINGMSKDVVSAVNGTTKAVNNVSETIVENGGTTTQATPAFGSPGSSFDLASEASKAVETIASAATSAFNKVRDDVVAAALKQTRSKAGESRGLLGKDIDAGYLGNLIVELTGVEIEVRDNLEKTYDEIIKFREGSFSGFDETGQLISDTAALVQRNQSSIELAASEQARIQKALIKAVIKYLITNVLIPIITAILGAMITLATTAIGAAVGSAIPIIGTAIGAAVGAAVGAALAGLAAVFTSLLAVGAGAAIDAFDEGGIAPGLGYMPKNTIAPERVLSPRQTASFERLVELLDGKGGPGGGNRSVNVASMTINGTGAADKSADRLLTLLNT